MKIKIKCPTCNAANELSVHNRICRRCENDLTLYYQFKYYSYFYRLKAIEAIITKDNGKAAFFLKKAKSFSKEN